MARAQAFQAGQLLAQRNDTTFELVPLATTGDSKADVPVGEVDVKGMFVDPAQVNEVAKRHQEIGRFRLVVTSENNVDQMTLKCEA